MIFGVVGLRCVGVLACLSFFGACCGLIGWLLAGLENKGQRLIFAGFGSRNGKICRAFRGRLLFSHVVRVFVLENIWRQGGHYTLGLFFGATDFMKKLCSGGLWRGVPYGVRHLELSRVAGAAVAVSTPARRAKVCFGWYVGA